MYSNTHWSCRFAHDSWLSFHLIIPFLPWRNMDFELMYNYLINIMLQVQKLLTDFEEWKTYYYIILQSSGYFWITKQYNLLSRKSERVEGDLCSSRKHSFHKLFRPSLWILGLHWSFWLCDKTLRYVWTNLLSESIFSYEFTELKIECYWCKSETRIEFWPMNISVVPQKSSVQSVKYHHS